MPLIDRKNLVVHSDSGSGEQFFAITTSDVTELPFVIRKLYVGGAGAVVAVNEAGVAVTFTAVPVGTTLDIWARRINATGTTATLLVGMY